MTQLTIKIVGTEDDSVMVKFVSENSAKPIDEYDAVAFQPKAMGFTTKEEFLNGIEQILLNQVIIRDKLESSPEPEDINTWADSQELTKEVVDSNLDPAEVIL